MKRRWLCTNHRVFCIVLWFESLCQWLTDYCLAIPTVLGSIKAVSCPITELGQTPPLPSAAWTGNQLQMQTLEEGEAQCGNQNQASLASLPACTMNLFLGPGAGGGAELGVLMGAWTKLATGQLFSSTKDTLDRSHLRCQTAHHYRGYKKKKPAQMCFICKCVITSNLQSQITTW